MNGRLINWEEVAPEIVRLRKKGYSYSKIGYILKISRDSVSKKLKELGVDPK